VANQPPATCQHLDDPVLPDLAYALPTGVVREEHLSPTTLVDASHGLLLALGGAVRPCVLAARWAAARAGTLNAGRGGSKASRRARRRVQRLGPRTSSGQTLGAGSRRLGLVVGSSHARGRTRRASPVIVVSTRRGAAVVG